MTTLTQRIFEANAPYSNPHQGTNPRVLFVCTAGILRSPTAARVAQEMFGWNTRSCGSNQHCAIIPLTVNLILWADTIVFMNSYNYHEAIQVFEPVGYDEDIECKAVRLDIEDEYDYMQPALVAELRKLLYNLKLKT